jgi:hypothetical protein
LEIFSASVKEGIAGLPMMVVPMPLYSILQYLRTEWFAYRFLFKSYKPLTFQGPEVLTQAQLNSPLLYSLEPVLSG